MDIGRKKWENSYFPWNLIDVGAINSRQLLFFSLYIPYYKQLNNFKNLFVKLPFKCFGSAGLIFTIWV